MNLLLTLVAFGLCIAGAIQAAWLPHGLLANVHQFGDQSVELEIRYLQPAGETVEIVWGINGWQAAPLSWGPDGTYEEEGLLVSPMESQQGVFSTTLWVAPETDVDFRFRMTPIGFPVETAPIWEGIEPDAFHSYVKEDKLLIIESGLSTAAIWGFEEAGSLPFHSIEYAAPTASSVMLVWGVNGWQGLPVDLLPANTSYTDTGLMQTPLEPKGDHFAVKLPIPTGTNLDFGFSVTMLDESNAEHVYWDGDYRTTVGNEEPTQLESQIEPLGITAPSPFYSRPAIFLALMGLAVVVGTIVTSIAITRSRIAILGNNGNSLSRRDLLVELVYRDIKLRYRRSVLGILWSLISPLLQLIVLGLVFRFILPLDIENFTLFLFIGLLSWIWFQSSIMSGTASIVDNRDLIRRPYFPIGILPTVPIASNLIHFLLSLPVVFLILALTGNRIPATVALLPLIIVVQFLFTWSLANYLAVLEVSFRDTEHLVSVLLLLWFYLSPVFYNSEIIPEQYQPLFALNPMVHIISGYRDVLMYGQIPPLLPLLTIAVLSLPMIFSGRRFLQINYNRFVEEL